MAKTKDGGQAFPQPFTGHCGSEDHSDPCGCYLDFGMTLRDYFAAKAIAVCALEKDLDYELIAGRAYELADAMIRHRANHPVTM